MMAVLVTGLAVEAARAQASGQVISPDGSFGDFIRPNAGVTAFTTKYLTAANTDGWRSWSKT